MLDSKEIKEIKDLSDEEIEKMIDEIIPLDKDNLKSFIDLLLS